LRAMAAVALHALLQMLLLATGQASDEWLYAEPGETIANSEVQARWGEVSPTCSYGSEQSPIDITTAEAPAKASLPPINFSVHAAIDHLQNTGHGYQVFETSPYSSIYQTGQGQVDLIYTNETKGTTTIGGDVYNFYQFHFHTPSENTIDGEQYDMEVHAVHQLNDPALVGTNYDLMVLAWLFRVGPECNEWLDQFWYQFPLEQGEVEFDGNLTIDTDALKDALLTNAGYYYWHGSLTTPDCTEGVRWYLMKHTLKVCQAQVDYLKQGLLTTKEVPLNNRLAQPLNARIVVQTPPCRPCPAPDSQRRRELLFASNAEPPPCCPPSA